jgi:signal transduction histidine kinase/CheY-like chemotaxis protein
VIAAVLDALFLLVLIRVLSAYRHGRDPVQRDVVLVFAAMAVFFARNLVRELGGSIPDVVSGVLNAALLAQPLLTLRLVGRLRPVPRWAWVWVTVAYAASLAVTIASPGRPPLGLQLARSAALLAGGGLAAAFLASEGQRRSGSPRIRLRIAAIATATFGAAFAVNVVGSVAPDVREAFRTAARAIGLLAALGYAAAFVPPGWLRRFWAATAVYGASRTLLDAPAADPPERTWRRYAATARDIRGADGAVVLLRSAPEQVVEAGCAGVADEPGAAYPSAELDDLLSRPQPIAVDATADPPALALHYAGRLGARYVRMVPLRMPHGRDGALLLLNRHRSLFVEDDIRLLADLARHAGIIAERAATLADRERLAAELAASVEALMAANQAKTDFLTSMSHELRTPLNAIIGFSDLMRGELPDGDRRLVPAEWIDNIHTSGRHLLDLINDVLDLAKIEAGRLELHPEPVDLAGVLAETVAALRPLALRKGVHLDAETLPVTVRADRLRLRQILNNLVSNAIKFTPAQGSVRLTGARADGEVLVTVVDTGVGIAPEDQELIFEQFQQVGDRSANQAGTGIGLALTRRLVEAHGGSIGLESEVGHGSRFTVRLPAADRADPADPGTQPAGAVPLPAGQPEPSAPRRGGILIIEDGPTAADLLRAYLEGSGYVVNVAPNGESGLAIARRLQPDAILLDLLLPGIDGWEVLRRLKLDDTLRDIPVVIVTVLDEQDVGLALGAVDYLVKPIDRHTLLARLARHGLLPAPETPATVLVIDDDPATLTIVEASLAPHGVRVLTAGTGADGLRLARRGEVDLILCDLLMPEMDGFTVIAELADDPVTRRVPVLVITAHELSAADKTRLGGKILGVISKGEALHEGLRDWLMLATRAPRAQSAPTGTAAVGPTP